jgi:penicillin-binding protein 2
MVKRFTAGKNKDMVFVSLKDAMKQSCDTYFYEVARKLGVDRLKITAEKFGLGNKVLGEYLKMKKQDNFLIQNGK